MRICRFDHVCADAAVVAVFSAHNVAVAYAFLQLFDYGNGLIIIVTCNNYYYFIFFSLEKAVRTKPYRTVRTDFSIEK